MKNKEKINKEKLKNKKLHVTLFVVFLSILLLTIILMFLIEKCFFPWDIITKKNYDYYILHNPYITFEQFKELGLEIQYGYYCRGLYWIWLINKIIPVALIIISLGGSIFEITNFFFKITN